MKYFGILGATIQNPKWSLTYDGEHQWGANFLVQDAQTILAGICQGMGLQPDTEELAAFIKANLAKPVTVQWQGQTCYTGTIASLYVLMWKDLNKKDIPI